jgi:branched-chain amino acid transport system substrate-binding protein
VGTFSSTITIRMKGFVVSIVLLVGLLCPAFSEGPVVVGASLSFSGDYREPSEMILNSYRLWEQQINEGGGLLGRDVELVILDDKSRVGPAAENYRNLFSKYNVDLVLSPYSTPLTVAASEISEKNGYVMIACGAAGEEIWDRGYRYIFGMYSMARRYFIGFLDLLGREGLDDISILHETNAFNIDAAEGAVQWAEKFGVNVIEKTGFDPKTADLGRLLRKTQEKGPDGLIVCSYPPAGYTLLNIMTAMDYKPEALAMTIIPIHPEFAVQAGAISENIFGPSQWEPIERMPFPGTEQFIEDFRSFTGQMPSYHATSAYAACKILEQAVTATKALNHDRIRDYIITLDTVTVLGRYKVDYTGRQIGHNSILIQWQDGKKEIVYPSHMSTAEPRF